MEGLLRVNTIYLTHEGNEESLISSLIQKAKTQGYAVDNIMIDSESNRIHWAKRDLSQIVEASKPGDTLVTDDASHLACSTLQILEILELFTNKRVNLYFIRYDYLFTPPTDSATIQFLQIIQQIEAAFITKRTTDALARRRAAGLPLGRPKGRKNKTRKLDIHRQDIKQYLALNISKASIAKLVGCHAQTLYNYINDTRLAEDVDNDRRQLLQDK